MPRLHPITGLAACGTAGGRVTYGGRSGEAFPLCDGGCTFWLNADEIAYLGPLSGSWAAGGPTAPQAVNIHTGARRPLEAVPPGAPLREASFLAAGGGRWQAAQAGQGATFGSCGEFPGGTISRAMTDGRGAAAADGSIALVDLYQGGGNGFRISRPSGELYPPASSPGIGAGEPDTYHLTLVDANRAIWPGPDAWRTIGIAPPLWIPGSLRAIYLEIAGVAYLVHWLNSAGLVARRADSSIGKILATADREFHYDAIAWNGGIRVAWATIDGEPPGSLEIVEWDLVSGLEELAPPPPLPRPTFRFTHPISIYPFKAEGSGRPDLFTLGTYTENPTPSSPLPAGRLLLAHDGESDWTIPVGALRSYDLVLWELYRVKSETLAQSAARWERQARAYLAQWPRDCGLIPMFYNQFNPATGAWLWTDAEVLEGLEYLDAIANLDARIKVIAPFSFDRANGIKPNPNLRRTFDDLVAAAAAAGESTLTPIPRPPDPPIDPPKPPNPFHSHTKGSRVMEIDGKTVRLRGPAGKLLAPDAPNTGTWGSLGKGWRGAKWLDDENDPAVQLKAKKVGNRYTFTHVEHLGIAGADGSKYSGAIDQQFYFKPDGDTDAGDYELWRVYDGNENGALEAQIEHVTDDDRRRPYFACPLAVEVVS